MSFSFLYKQGLLLLWFPFSHVEFLQRLFMKYALYVELETVEGETSAAFVYAYLMLLTLVVLLLFWRFWRLNMPGIRIQTNSRDPLLDTCTHETRRSSP